CHPNDVPRHGPLPKKAAMLIATDHFYESLQTANLWVRFICMPLQIAPHPEYAPQILCSNKGGFCDGVLHFLLRILPIGTNLEDLNAVTCDSVAEIELGANVRRRTMALHELRKIALAPLPLDVVECHGSPRIRDA